MKRRESRALARRSALALSLLLVVSTLALPAIAEDTPTPTAGIIAPEEDDVFAIGEELLLRANSGREDVVNWAVRLDDPSRNSSGTKAGNVDGFTDDFALEDGEFSASVDTEDWEPSKKYFFVFNWGNPNDDGTREVVQFSLLDPALDGFVDAEVEQCDDGGDCDIKQGGFTASTTNVRGKDGKSAFLGLRLAGDDPVAEVVSDLCEAEVAKVNRPARLGPDAVQLVPVNFADGSITVESTIPGSFVDKGQRRARGAGIFQVCVAPEESSYGGYPEQGEIKIKAEDSDELEGTGFYGPIILDDCGAEPTPDDACVLSKTKEDGDVILTYQLPTQDPWLK